MRKTFSQFSQAVDWKLLRVQVTIPTRTIPTSTIPTLTIPTRTCVTNPNPNPTCATCRPRRRAPPADNRPTIITLVGMVGVGMVPAPQLLLHVESERAQSNDVAERV